MSSEQSMKRGAIVLLDVLGTKTRWNKDEEKFLFNEWEQILQFMEKVADTSKEIGMLINIKSLSDTILISFSTDPKITTKSENWNDHVILKFASSAAAYLLALGLSLNISFRGCIAFGDYYENERALTGKIMFEAAEYHERAQWIGVSLTPSANLIASRNAKLSSKDIDFHQNAFIVSHDIPLKGIIEKNGYGVNFVKSYEAIINQRKDMGDDIDKNSMWSKIDISKSIDNILQDQLNINPGIEPSLKIRNTMEFIVGI